jgi:hypothetical protein
MTALLPCDISDIAQMPWLLQLVIEVAPLPSLASRSNYADVVRADSQLASQDRA